MSTITLTGDYRYTQYRVKDLAAGTVIDASDATFIVDNNVEDDGRANPYPVAVRESSNIVLQNGTVLGVVDQEIDRDIIYHTDPGNSAAIRAEDAPNFVVRGWRIDDAWDGIRVSWNTQNFLIEDVWMTDVRDDAIENDKLNSGTIRNCLLDGVMAGLSIDPSSSSPVDGSAEKIVIDNVLIRLKTYLSEGKVTHGSPIKVDKALGMPDLHITNSVFAIEIVDHNGWERLGIAWENVVESSGNVFLNLSDTPLPDGYPMPPAGWTVLQGQEARDYWAQARAEWVAEHLDMALPGDDSTAPVSDDDSGTPTTDDPATDEPTTDELVSSFEGEYFEGSDGNDLIIGNSLDNYIDGNNGNDVIRGGAGNDTIRSDDGVDELWGGAGNDIFLFKHASDSRDGKGIDTIKDFTPGDRIDVSRIDANRGVSGDQAFELITGGIAKAGQLSVTYDATTGYTIIQGNTDNELRPELIIHLEGEIGLTAEDFIL